MNAVASAVPARGPQVLRPRTFVFTLLAIMGGWFVVANAVPYVVPDALHASRYTGGRRPWRMAAMAIPVVTIQARPSPVMPVPKTQPSCVCAARTKAATAPTATLAV